MTLATAHGLLTSDTFARFKFACLDCEFVCVVLESKPNVLSLGTLIEAGYGFRWIGSEARLRLPGNASRKVREMRLPIVNNCPFLLSSTPVLATSAATSEGGSSSSFVAPVVE